MAEDQPTSPGNVPVDGAEQARQISLIRIYCKDASLEVPLAPKIFNRDWKPEVSVQVNTNVDQLEDGAHHVVLILTVTAKTGSDTAYLAEAHQAGVFNLSGFTDPSEIGAVLGAYCPNILFPFAREAIASLIQRSGFPPLLLQPINFDLLYAQHVERSKGAPAGNDQVAPNRVN